MKIGNKKALEFDKPKLIKDIQRIRTNYRKKRGKLPNAIYLGYKQLDELLELKPYVSVLGGDKVMGMVIFPIELMDFMVVKQEDLKTRYWYAPEDKQIFMTFREDDTQHKHYQEVSEDQYALIQKQLMEDYVYAE